jgi:hypothetical protein
MAPLRRADAEAEAWAWGALAPLCASWARSVTLPAGCATHRMLLHPSLERALRVTPSAEVYVQRAAVRLAFLQLEDADGARVMRTCSAALRCVRPLTSPAICSRAASGRSARRHRRRGGGDAGGAPGARHRAARAQPVRVRRGGAARSAALAMR